MKGPRTLGNPRSTHSERMFAEQTAKVLDGNVSFGATTSNTDLDINIDGWKATGTTPGVSGTTFSVNHNLKRIPIGFIPIRLNVQGAVLTDSGVAWTAATNSAQGTISLVCNAATVNFTIIII